MLLHKLQTALAKFEGERILIDFLEKTGPKFLLTRCTHAMMLPVILSSTICG